MNSSPSFSVLLSVWNGMPYLPQTIASIRAQSFTDFEFVIVDNVSTDGTREYLREVQGQDSRIRLIFNETNLGHSGGLNRGLAECETQWVARIDADDVALPERLARQIAFISEWPLLGVASCLAYYIAPDGRRVGKTYHDLKTPADFHRYVSTGEMIGLLHPGAFLDRALVQSLGGYREQFREANDIDLWARIAETGRQILVQQEYLMEYRIHPAQGGARFFEARMRYEWVRICARARRAGEQEPDWDAFVAMHNGAPWLQRLNRKRKTHAKYWYRSAGLDYVCGRRVRAAAKIAGAIILQPEYALSRLAGQRLK